MNPLSKARAWLAEQPARRARLASVPAAASASVVFQDIGKQFGQAADAPRVLHAVDLTIERGRIFGIIGRSGAGKSTLLRLVNRLETASRGTVLVHGRDVAGLDAEQLVLLRRRIGMVFQHFNLLSTKTVWQNVALPLQMAGVPPAQVRTKVDALLELVGLSAKHASLPAALSGGQKQRVGIARALVHDPDILLCDEATSALDPETTQAILALLKDIRRRLGLTIILITHEMAVIREICDSVAVLEAGQVVESGAVWRVFGDPQHAATRSLLQPLLHDLPHEWSSRLRSSVASTPPNDEPLHMVLDLRFSGATREVDLGLLLLRCAAHSPKVRLIQSVLEPIQGRLQGRVVLALELALPATPAAVLQDVRSLADRVEVLGYV